MSQTSRTPRKRTARHEGKWVDTPGEQPRKRFQWGWLVLLVIPALIVFYFVADHNNYWNHQDVTVTTMSCQEPLVGEPTWADMEAAGCAPAAIGVEMRLLDGGQEVTSPRADGATWTFPGAPTAFSTISTDVVLSESVDRLFIVNADADPPEVGREMNADASGTRFSSNIGERNVTSYYFVASPAE